MGVASPVDTRCLLVKHLDDRVISVLQARRLGFQHVGDSGAGVTQLRRLFVDRIGDGSCGLQGNFLGCVDDFKIGQRLLDAVYLNFLRVAKVDDFAAGRGERLFQRAAEAFVRFDHDGRRTRVERQRDVGEALDRDKTANKALDR